MDALNATKIFVPLEFVASLADIFTAAQLSFQQFKEDGPIVETDFVLFTERSSAFAERAYNIILAAVFGQDFYKDLSTAPSALILQPTEGEDLRFFTSETSYLKHLAYPLLQPEPVGEDFLVHSQYGPVKFLNRQYEFARHFEGIKMLCQQVGIYEETFFDALTL